MNRRRILITMAKVFLLLLTLALPWTLQERVYADSGGSISVNLKDLGTSRKDVAFTAYKIATLDEAKGSWKLDDRLADTGVSLDELEYAADWDDAAMKISKSGELAKFSSLSGKTNQDGGMKFSNLELGMYLVVQDDQGQYGLAQPFLAAIPYTENGIAKVDLTVEPKATPLVKGKGRIVVTMRASLVDSQLLELTDVILQDDVVCYVGLFKDKQGQIPYGTDYMRQISMKGVAKGTAVFEDLPAGTYYVFETDKDGNAYRLKEKQAVGGDVWESSLDGISGQEIVIDENGQSQSGAIGFCRQYYTLSGKWIALNQQAKPEETKKPEGTKSPAENTKPEDNKKSEEAKESQDAKAEESQETKATATGDGAFPMISMIVAVVSLVIIVGEAIYWRGHKEYE